MSAFARAPVTAILGPTNTGKTHLAIERMCGHSSGIIGFPLRLLAREVYDRVVRIKGEKQVALITGEEKIVPPDARYFLCTVESMPVETDHGFVAVDEAQLGIDPERGHVFTDRMLHARGRDETMILGSESLAPMVRALVPKAEIIGRPRFSTLSYVAPTKLSRLPPRSAIVAFSAEQVYAVAEMLRRTRGGAAVVMGALSPRTRNAQVAMYQAGEVDYLVATDAIGMGLNMDVAHVAFAGLTKFDGRRRRRLTPAEMAQIAGRAGRHQRDGTFGTLTLGGDRAAEFTPEEIAAIEEHRFAPIDFLHWREGNLDLSSVERLIASLERRPSRVELRAAPEAVDLLVLKRLAEDPDVLARARGPARVRRLWAACGLPDFRKTGPDHHARLVATLYTHLSQGNERIPRGWFAEQVARLDNVQGDIETLADRLAGVRTWAYIAHRPDWLADPAEMIERTRGLEERLSDALHERLTQRFVDRRTSVLLRQLGGREADLPVVVDAEGEVTVGSHPIGRLDGFDFQVDPAARHTDRKMLLATAERRLGGEYERRAAALVADEPASFVLDTAPATTPAIGWRGHAVARLGPGKNLLSPRILLDRRLDRLSPTGKAAVTERLGAWVGAEVVRHLGLLRRAGQASHDPKTLPAARSVLAMLVDNGGVVARAEVAKPLAALPREARRAITRLGVRIGALDLFIPAMLRPEPVRWRAALRAAATGDPMPALPPAGAVVLPAAANDAERRLLERIGYRSLGPQLLRVDLAERIAHQAHQARAGKQSEVIEEALITSLGLQPPALARLMRDIGFRPSGGAAGWVWRGHVRQREERAVVPGNAFAAALAELRRG
jgi:ATP-dependent RNA helicase SUPV3L1/SUV3